MANARNNGLTVFQNRVVRYIVTVVAFITTASMTLLLGVLLGSYDLKLVFPIAQIMIVTVSMAAAVLLPAYIVKTRF